MGRGGSWGVSFVDADSPKEAEQKMAASEFCHRQMSPRATHLYDKETHVCSPMRNENPTQCS